MASVRSWTACGLALAMWSCYSRPAGVATDAAGAGAAGGAVACSRSQAILPGALKNARDLGGLPVPPASSVACGALYRGPPLAKLSAEACLDVAHLGIKTLIDLRTESERAATPNQDCDAAQRVEAPLPIPYGLAAADYLNVLNTTPSIALAFHTLGNPEAYPVYFHCTWGRDRTGVVAALILLALGATTEDVMREYLLSSATVGAYPDSLTAVLDEVERRGGIEAFLSDAGVTANELTVLRSHVVETG